LAVHQVGSYLGYTGRDADIVAEAAPDPVTSTLLRSSIVLVANDGIF
jgi:hypothetical protein